MESSYDLEACYRILELPPEASLEDVKLAWRDLVKIWHPDRFADDPRLQARCQDKIKEINRAYETLKQHGGSIGTYTPVMYYPDPSLCCVRCSRVLPLGVIVCEWCLSPADEAVPVRDTTTWRWTLSGIGVIVIAAVVFHFAFDGMQHTFAYLFVLLAGFAFLRQVYHSLR